MHSVRDTLPMPGFVLSRWIVGGLALILFVCMLVLSLRSNERERLFMTASLLERADTLIWSLETGFHTGMCLDPENNGCVEDLFHEAANQSGVLSMMVTDMHGHVLLQHHRNASSQPQTLVDIPEEVDATPRWRLREENGTTVFEVYRAYIPGGMGHSHVLPWMWRHAEPLETPTSMAGIVFVGFDARPLEEVLEEDAHTNYIIAAATAGLALLAVQALAFLQHLRLLRQRLRDERIVSLEVMTRLPLGLITCDAKGDLALINDAALDLLGLHRAAFSAASMPITSLPGPDWKELCTLLDAGDFSYEERSTRAGTTILGISGARLHDRGRLLGTLFVLRDMTQLRRLQADAARADRLTALGHLAAGIAHEVRNPLSTLKGTALYLARRLPSGGREEEAASRMLEEVERLEHVVSSLLDFAKAGTFAMQPTDLRCVVDRALRLAHADLEAKKIEVHKNIPAAFPTMCMNAEKMTQVLLNLFLNAVHAMEMGGILGIDVAVCDAMCTLTVTDTGHGIAEEAQASLFTPFFTTKASGTGLGLAIVYSIVSGHKGQVRCFNRPEGGAAFTITLPLGVEGEKCA